MDAYPQVITCPVIDLDLDLVDRRLGIALGRDTIISYLSRLGFGVEDQGATLRVTVPTWRATKDIGIAEDLIEEVGRSYGYDNIAPQPPSVTLSKPHPNKQKYFERAVRGYLTQAGGVDEIMTYSFDSEPLLKKIDAVPSQRMFLKNVISAEMPAMRTALGPNLLSALLRNERREDRIRVFEIGRVFTPAADDGDLPFQPVTLGVLVGDANIGNDPDATIFAHMKGLVMGLAQAVSRQCPRLEQGGVSVPWAHPVRQARVMAGDVPIGYVTEVHPLTLNALDLKHGTAIIEINLDTWRAQPEAAAGYTALPKFPSVYRDFAVVVGEDVRAGAVQSAIAGVNAELIRNVEFQSAFRSSDLGGDRKCLAWSVTVRHDDRTMQDGEIRDLEEQIWSALTDEVGGVQRT